jgi:hypothetical protein
MNSKRLEVRELLLTLLDHDRGEQAGVEGRVSNAVNDVRDTTDVVEVSVRNEESTDFIAAFFKIASVRQNVVDTRSIIFAELETTVDDYDVITVLNRCHVAADFLHASKRDNADIPSFKWRYWLFVRTSV